MVTACVVLTGENCGKLDFRDTTCRIQEALLAEINIISIRMF